MRKSLLQKSPGLANRQLTPLPPVYKGKSSDNSPPLTSQTSYPPINRDFSFNTNNKIGRAASSKEPSTTSSLLNGLPSINKVDNSPTLTRRIRSNSIQKPEAFNSNLDEITIDFEPIAEEMSFTLSPSHTVPDTVVRNVDISENLTKHKRSASTPFQLEALNKSSYVMPAAPKPLSIISMLTKTSNQALYSISNSVEKIVNHELSPTSITEVMVKV